MTSPAYTTLVDRLSTAIDPDRISTDLARRLAHGTDASFYRLVPEVVVHAETLDEIELLVRECAGLSLPVTFRGAGTSLSGQAITDSVLVLTSPSWTDLEVLDDGRRIRLQPGVIGRRANAALSPFGRKIGPDPASINAATIGGIVANNASGMCCGTAQNSYQTMSSCTVVLADGTRLDSGDPESVRAFRESRPDLVEALGRISAEARADEDLTALIRAKYAMKNTMGYSLNALVDFEDEVDVLTHLMVGSEGTLGFLGEVVYDTVADDPHKASALVVFPTLTEACEAVTALSTLEVSAVELMDRASLRSVESRPELPDLSAAGDEVAALLVEVRGRTATELADRVTQASDGISHIDTVGPVEFSDDPETCSRYWSIRKGLFPTVGAVRRAGTTVVIEDVVFPVARLAPATRELQELLVQHGYDEAVIFGHALEGNVHFVFTPDFTEDAEVERYRVFLDELADLVVERHGGALKAEHGTGRNMAPFLEAEWGAAAVGLMQQIKAAFDPEGILNPGVILNDDAEVHLKDLKRVPAADPLIDTCTECGFCESSCLSHGLTLSPRHRIVLEREAARLRAAGLGQQADELVASTAYEVDATCATDGLCSVACPVGIDTGKLVKQHRARDRADSRIAGAVASRVGRAAGTARLALRAGHVAERVLGRGAMDAVASGTTRLLGAQTHWVEHMPRAAEPLDVGLQPVSSDALEVVYVNACINRIFGPDPDGDHDEGVAQHVVNLLHKADCRVVLPAGLDDGCCGLAFGSQGFTDAAATAQQRLVDAIVAASDGGRRPVVCDMSPCTLELRPALAERGIHVYDIIDLVTSVLVDRLEFEPGDEMVQLFPVCSVKKMGLEDELVAVGRLVATDFHVPDTNCCGFAGNRGMLQPELTEFALRDLAAQTPDEVSAGYSTSRTCEIGLTTHGARPYGSLVRLLDEHTSPRRPEATAPA